MHTRPRHAAKAPRPLQVERRGVSLLGRLVREQRGVAAVEFAILLPVLCALILGMIDYGFFFFLNSTAVNAAREGARSGVVVTTGAADAEAAAEAVATTYLAAANIDVGDCLNCASTVDAVVVGDNLEMTVTIDPYTPLTGFLPASALPSRATHTSIMRVEGFTP